MTRRYARSKKGPQQGAFRAAAGDADRQQVSQDSRRNRPQHRTMMAEQPAGKFRYSFLLFFFLFLFFLVLFEPNSPAADGKVTGAESSPDRPLLASCMPGQGGRPAAAPRAAACHEDRIEEHGPRAHAWHFEMGKLAPARRTLSGDVAYAWSGRDPRAPARRARRVEEKASAQHTGSAASRDQSERHPDTDTVTVTA